MTFTSLHLKSRIKLKIYHHQKIKNKSLKTHNQIASVYMAKAPIHSVRTEGSLVARRLGLRNLVQRVKSLLKQSRILTSMSSPVIPRMRKRGEITEEGIKREIETDDQNKTGANKQETCCLNERKN